MNRRTVTRISSSFLLALVLSVWTGRAQADSIPFTGLEALGMGTAAWNANGSGPEPAHTGHAIPAYLQTWTGPTVAYYYVASRDYVDPASTYGYRGSGTVTGFASFSAALAANGFSVSDLTIRVPLVSLGADVQGVDWLVAGDTETRYYAGATGPTTIYLGGSPMVSQTGPRATLNIDYNAATTPWDDVLSGLTDYFTPVNASGGSPAGVQAVAAALLSDVGSGSIRYEFLSMEPATQMQFASNGRDGAYFEVQTGAITMNPEPTLVPEPSTLSLLGVGVTWLAWNVRRRFASRT